MAHKDANSFESQRPTGAKDFRSEVDLNMIDGRLVSRCLFLKRIAYVVTLLSLITLSACFERLRIEVTQANPPKFILHGGGSGYIGSISVREVLDEHNSHNDVWMIGPNGSSEPLSHFHSKEILFGKVPQGWHEVIPRTDQPPPVLEEGKTYVVICHTFDIQGAGTVFTIRNGKAVSKDPN